MPHGVSSTQHLAFHNTSRSFTDVRNATTTASKDSTGRSFNTMFGGMSNTWGTDNIWRSGSLTSSLASRAHTRDSSRARDTPQGSANQAEEIEGKKGSKSLLDGTSGIGNWNSSYGNKRNDPLSRSFSQARYPEQPTAQQRSYSNTGLQPSLAGASGASQSYSTFTARLPTINLNGTSSAQPRASFDSGMPSKSSGREYEQPPTVYTKFDRSTDTLKRGADSAVGLSWPDISPSTERPPLTAQYNTNGASNSRGPGVPSSRDSDQQYSLSMANYSCAAHNNTSNSSREQYNSSQRNGAYDSFSSQSTDQMAAQLSQMRFNGGSRSSTSYKSPGSAGAYATQTSPYSAVPAYGKGLTNGYPNDYDNADEIEDIERAGMQYLGSDGYMSPSSTTGFPDYASSGYANRFMQTPTNVDYRNAQVFTPSSMSTRSSDLPNGPRSPSDWQGYSNGGAMTANRRPRGVADQQAYIDPRLQQLLAAQLRSSYASMYNPYVEANPLQVPSVPQYLPMMPMALNGIDPNTSPREGPAGDGVQSILMYEFKSNTKTKRYELKDIYDHIAEFSGDQHGSRFIQTKLETANSDEKEQVFREIEPNAIQLMTDVFGNYVIQKFFEHGDQMHKKILANKMRGQVLNLSMQMYGCRVVQKALDHVLVDQQAMLISELETHVLKCVKDQNGNHVIQKAIERCPSHTIGFITDAFRGQVQHLSIHPYGCRVIQRCLERCDTPSKAMIMAELMDGIQGMISDQYGNYVVQHVVSKNEGLGRQRVLQIVLHGLENYSTHKFASNVVEKCLEQADDAWRRQVIFMLADRSQRRVEGEGVIVGLIKDNFGNYVIQKLLDTLCAEDFAYFVDVLQPAVNQAKRTGCGKQLLSVEKKMHRLPPRWNGPGNGNTYGHNAYQLPLPTPPFASRFASAANTPPPLTADSQSLQSSAIPSINGDAVEGADRSRKGSEPSNDGKYER